MVNRLLLFTEQERALKEMMGIKNEELIEAKFGMLVSNSILLTAVLISNRNFLQRTKMIKNPYLLLLPIWMLPALHFTLSEASITKRKAYIHLKQLKDFYA